MYVLPVSITFVSVATITVALRLFTRIRLVCAPWWDDWFLVLALVSTIFSSIDHLGQRLITDDGLRLLRYSDCWWDLLTCISWSYKVLTLDRGCQRPGEAERVSYLGPISISPQGMHPDTSIIGIWELANDTGSCFGYPFLYTTSP